MSCVKEHRQPAKLTMRTERVDLRRRTTAL